jgi:hypothetical protein
MIFYVYVDRTLSDVAFYVGKGDKTRLKDLRRNRYHTEWIQRDGIQREIVFATSVEQKALDYEVELISELRTYRYDVTRIGLRGANLTKGGEGVRGRVLSDQERLNIAQRKVGILGQPHTEETKQLLREKRTGYVASEELRQRFSKVFRERFANPIERAKLRGRRKRSLRPVYLSKDEIEHM